MAFAEFMSVALYHPSHGYYANRVPGHGCDYRTSPSISPWFGQLVARELEGMWETLGRPDPFWVVEVGGGGGDLAAGVMEGAGPMAAALRWRFVEQFERVQGWQRRRLGRAAAPAEWVRRLGDGPPVTGCVLGNEVLDAFPVHVFEVGKRGDVHELHVDVEGDRFVERFGPLSVPSLAEPARRVAMHLEAGNRFEICPSFAAWFREAAATLVRGYLLLVDYGDLEPDIWVRTPQGTLASPGPQDLGPSPLEAPGRKDLTARVNFSDALRAAQAAGLSPSPLLTQTAWLRSLGLEEVAEELDLARINASTAGWIEDAVELDEELRALMELTTPGELGDCLVLRGRKDAPALRRG
jgi:SAM-dependent MidA family methyltransferase